MQENSNLVLGIDPGYDRLGWAVARQSGQPLSVVAYGCIQTNKTAPTLSRYQHLISELEMILTQYRPQIAALETVFFSNNQKTAMRVAEVRGVIIAQLLFQNILIHEYNPMQVKLVATGDGKADKTAIAKMVNVQVRWPAGRTPTKSTLDDSLDAVAICLTDSVLSKQRV